MMIFIIGSGVREQGDMQNIQETGPWGPNLLTPGLKTIGLVWKSIPLLAHLIKSLGIEALTTTGEKKDIMI